MWEMCLSDFYIQYICHITSGIFFKRLSEPTEEIITFAIIAMCVTVMGIAIKAGCHEVL